jgi:hypothetical protein
LLYLCMAIIKVVCVLWTKWGNEFPKHNACHKMGSIMSWQFPRPFFAIFATIALKIVFLLWRKELL